MRERPYNPPRLGFVGSKTVEQLEKTYQTVERLSDFKPGSGNRALNSDAGTFVGVDGRPGWHALLTSVHQDPTTKIFHYGWKEVYINAQGVRVNLATDGTGGQTYRMPAFERNNQYINISVRGEPVYVWMTQGWGEWVEFSYCCGDSLPTTTTTTLEPTTTTTLPPQITTTTTTTTTPCTGTCKFIWDNATQNWTQVISTCGTGCVCRKPNYCGSISGEVTTTYCATTAGSFYAGCGCTPTTYPPCTGKCVYRCYAGNAYLISRNCSQGCSCEVPICNYIECNDLETLCSRPPSEGGGGSGACSGYCKYIWLPNHRKWFLIYHGCQGTQTCGCIEPSVDAINDCEEVAVFCRGSEDSCYTTTNSPGSCNGYCKYKWVSGSSSWVLQQTTCDTTLCGCYHDPPYVGTSDQETAVLPCVVATTAPPTTTTTTTTTTTCAPTTTAAPTCGQCTFQWYTTTGSSGAWLPVDSNCTGGCGCVPPATLGNTGCLNKVVTSCLGTTCSPVVCSETRTTAPPGDTNSSCGACEYKSIATLGSGCIQFVWLKTQNFCTANCTCQDPVCNPLTVGLTHYTACSGAGATTSTTTTTTTLNPNSSGCCAQYTPLAYTLLVAGSPCAYVNGSYYLEQKGGCVFAGSNGIVLATLYLTHTIAVVTLELFGMETMAFSSPINDFCGFNLVLYPSILTSCNENLVNSGIFLNPIC